MAKNPAASGADRPAGRRFLRQLDGRGGASSQRGTAPLKPYLGAIAAVNDQRRADRPVRDRRLSLSPVGIFIYPDLGDPTRYAVYASQARARAAQPRLLPARTAPNMTAYRAAYRAYVIRMQTLAGIADAAAQGRPHLRARNRHRQGPLDPRAAAATSRRPTIRWTRPSSPRFAPQLNWDRGAGQHRPRRASKRSSSAETSAIAGGGQVARQRAARRRGRTISPSTSSATTRNICPRRSTRRISISIRRRCATCRPSATAGSAASTLVNGALGEAVGQIYVAAPLSARKRPRRWAS